MFYENITQQPHKRESQSLTLDIKQSTSNQ